MGKKVNILKITEAFNRLRMECGVKKYSNNEILQKLASIGVSKSYAYRMITNNIIISENDEKTPGRSKLYSFPPNPVHKSQISRCYDEQRKFRNGGSKPQKVELSEKVCIEFLKSRGYILKKITGLNIKALQKEMPAVFEKYKIVEEI